MSNTSIQINDRQYSIPNKCAVVICLDGSEPEYIDIAIKNGLMPNLAKLCDTGTVKLADSAMPSFTNPNNMSIATGRPPSIHGICGNYLLDPETNQEVMMNEVRFLRCPTIFSKFFDAGLRVAVITAKDKLRNLLGADLSFEHKRAICFSSERADQTTVARNGIDNASKWLERPVPNVYSADLSEFVLAAGVKLMKEWNPDIMYLSTTDYIQHKFSPQQNGAQEFYSMIDDYIGQLNTKTTALVITADHGMKPKHDSDGRPIVIYVQDLLDDWLGIQKARVILPITDPYVVHHGALGSFATIYLAKEANISSIINKLSNTSGIQKVLAREDACNEFELPADRIGDVVIISEENVTIGTSLDRHDLEALKEPLRSHGGISEQKVPFILNKKIEIPKTSYLRNFDAFYYATQMAQTN